MDGRPIWAEADADAGGGVVVGDDGGDGCGLGICFVVGGEVFVWSWGGGSISGVIESLCPLVTGHLARQCIWFGGDDGVDRRSDHAEIDGGHFGEDGWELEVGLWGVFVGRFGMGSGLVLVVSG